MSLNHNVYGKCHRCGEPSISGHQCFPLSILENKQRIQYNESVYRVIIVSKTEFDNLDLSLTISNTNLSEGLAYLLANEEEIEYIKKYLNIDLGEINFDYFKLKATKYG